MKTVSKTMIENNYKAEVFKIRILGIDGSVFVKQTPSQVRQGKVSIYFKLAKEPVNMLSSYQDSYSWDSLVEYVKDELIEKQFIVG